MRLIWAGLLTLFAVLAVLLAYGVSYAILEDSDPALIKLSGVPLSALFATLAPLSLWAAWRLLRTSVPFWDAVYRPLIGALAVFSLFLALMALWFILDSMIREGAGEAAGTFVVTLPLTVMAGLAAWSAYRFMSVGAVWSALRPLALAGATLGSVTLLFSGIGVGILAYLSIDDHEWNIIIFWITIVIFTFPTVVFGTIGLTVALKLARTGEVSIAFGRWMTSAALAGVFFFLGFITFGAGAPGIVPLALWGLMLVAGLQLVRGSRWGTMAVLAIGFGFSGIAGFALGLPTLVPLALLALTLLWGLYSVRGSLSARAET